MTLSDALYFSRGSRSRRQANIGNTVLVNRGDGIWCLGYIQDIEGDHVFIDLDCAQYAPSWMHSRHVWQHHLTGKGVGKADSPPPALSTCVHVALRNEADGPYIFRPAQLLGYCIGVNMYLCCIMEESGDRRIVHRWQIVATLPDKEPSIFGQLDEIPIVKHVVQSEKINRIQAVDEYQISQFVDQAFDNGTGYPRKGEDRFFVQIGKANVTFIFLDIVRCSVVRNRSSDMTSASLDTFLEHYIQSGNERTGFGHLLQISGSVSAEAHDKLHCVLSWDILSEILRHLDFHSQLKAKRVCLSWNLALTKPASSYCVEIDFCNIRPKMTSRWDTEGYVVACLLDRAVTHHTRTLVLTNLSRRVVPLRGMILISNLLCFKGIHLNIIVLNQCEVSAELIHTMTSSSHLPFHLPKLMKACRRLVVSQYTIRKSFSCCSNRDFPGASAVMYHQNPAHDHRITISRVTFDCCPIDYAEIKRQIIIALESSCPPVDDHVREQFRELHAQWVHTVPYPDEWMAFKRLLQTHFVSEKPVPASYWDLLDLRDFDNLPLNKFILQMVARKCL